MRSRRAVSCSVRFCLLLAIVGKPVAAQLVPVSLEDRIDGAAVVVEGTVVASTPFLVAETATIRTAHRIRLSRAFKTPAGFDPGVPFVVITPGGRLEDRQEVVTPSLRLRLGDTGLLLAIPGASTAYGAPAYRPIAGPQGFVRYVGDGAQDPFARYADRERDLFPRVVTRTGRDPVGLSDESNEPSTIAPGPDPGAGALLSHSIASFNPGTVRGGIQEVLTINGSGFGTFTGSATVFFDDPDDGPGGNFGSVDPEHIVSWSDSQIQVRVPARVNGATAGTGSFVVRDSAGGDAFSPGPVTVEYALTEVNSSGLFRMNLQNQDRRGGYTFRYSTATANNGVDFTTVTAAVDRFEESVSEWNCAADWSAQVDGTTPVQATGNDGVNIVAFDNDADPLPAGVLGRATGFFESCGGDTWHVAGVDIRFRRDGTDGTDWYYGADPAGQGPTETDFKSVALHEVGHTVQHGHINDSGDLMYYALTTGTNNRTLSSADTAGGLEIVTYSAPFAACDRSGMLAFDCLAPPTTEYEGVPLGTCGTSLSVDFADLSLNGPTSWNWTFGDSGTSTLRNPTHFYASQGLYSVSLDAANANGSDLLSRANYIVVTDAPAAASCNPTFSGHDNCCAIGIRNVTFNTIDRSTDTNTEGDPLQEDFSCLDFTVLEPESTNPISIRTGDFNDENVRVYIDWNDDGTLAAGELAFSSGPGTVHNGNVTVPAGAVTDTALRMRVLSDFNPISSPCENIEFGQVEDYSVLVSAAGGAPPGAIPDTSMFVGKNATAGDLDFSWSASCGAGAVDYSIHEGTYGTWYSHSSVVCSTGGATSYQGHTPQVGDRYFLVAPLSASAEGSYGLDSSDVERPVSAATCLGSQDLSSCP